MIGRNMNRRNMNRRSKKFIYITAVSIFAVVFIAIAYIVLTIREEREYDPFKDINDIEVVDLRTLSGQEMYDTVKDLMEHPADHANTLVVASGMYHYHLGENGAKYCYCILYNDKELDFLPENAIEFVPQEKEWMNVENLKDGDIITVKGAFGVYMEDDMQYLALRNSVVNILVSKEDFDFRNKNAVAAEERQD